MSDDANEHSEFVPQNLKIYSRGTGDNEPVPLKHGTATEMVVREINATLAYNPETEVNELTFFYSRAWEPKTVTRAEFDTYVSALGRGQIPAGLTLATGTYMETPDPLETKKISKLSIRNLANRYLVFVLAKGFNWQFAQTGPAITVGRGLANISFFEGWRVDGAGNATHEGPDQLDDCRVAYVIAYDGSGGGKKRYAFPFNLNVDLHYPDGSLTPIVIDPDTRYPGGNTVVGEGP